MTKGNTQSFRLAERLERFVEIDDPGMIGRGGGLFIPDLGDIAGFPGDPLDIEARCDPLDPGRKCALSAELGAPLERLDEGVLGDVVGQRGLGPHPPQQAAHRRAVAAHQFSELPPSPRRRKGGELDVVPVDQGLGHAEVPLPARSQPLFLLKALRMMKARPMAPGMAAKAPKPQASDFPSV